MSTKRLTKRRTLSYVFLVSSGAFAFGLIDSCDDSLVALTQFVDPCGTILANCDPGDFAVLNADIGDSCIDPACTLPGGCGVVPLGTVREICP